MTIPLTIVGPERSTDVVLPAHIPLAVLSQELAALTGHPSTRLLSLTGRELDPALGLLDNGVAGGALLLAGTDNGSAPMIDDITDAAVPYGATDPAHRIEAQEVALALVVALLAGWTVHLGAIAPVAMLALAMILGWAVLPRLVLRCYGITAATDPRDAAVGARVRAAHRAMLHAGRVLAAGTLAGGVALVAHASVLTVLAGWLLLLTVSFRAAGHDRAVAIGVLAGVAAALVTGAQHGTAASLGAVLVGGLVVAGSLGSARYRASAQVLRQYAERVVTLVLPVTLLAAAGLLPPLPT